MHETWVFGYGSLLWNVDFPYCEKVIGHVEGFERKFWQGSVRCRGSLEKPGRVATLIEKEGGIVWGAAYRLSQEGTTEVLQHLKRRERAYDTIKTVFHPRDKDVQSIELLLYIGTPDNPNYKGPENIQDTFNVIVNSSGPSGTNIEYLLNLADYVRKNIPEDNDDHLFELERMVRHRTEH